MKPTIPPNEDPSTVQNIESKKDGLEGLVANMPQVVPDAIDAAKAQEDGIKNANADFIDKFGHKFDSNLHDVDDDGNPKITPSGRLKYKAGAKFKTKVDSIINAPKQETKDPEKLKIQAASEQFADSFIAAGTMIVGEEWKDLNGERDQLVNANYRVFERYGVVEIHPIANITLVYGLYIFKRVMKPQSKSQMVWNHICKQTGEFFKKSWLWIKINIFRQRPVTMKPQEKKQDAQSPKIVSA